MIAIQVLAFVVGLLLVLRALLSAIRTFVVPRGAYDGISSMEFRLIGSLFGRIARPGLSYVQRDASAMDGKQRLAPGSSQGTCGLLLVTTRTPPR